MKTLVMICYHTHNITMCLHTCTKSIIEETEIIETVM